MVYDRRPPVTAPCILWLDVRHDRRQPERQPERWSFYAADTRAPYRIDVGTIIHVNGHDIPVDRVTYAAHYFKYASLDWPREEAELIPNIWLTTTDPYIADDLHETGWQLEGPIDD